MAKKKAPAKKSAGKAVPTAKSSSGRPSSGRSSSGKVASGRASTSGKKFAGAPAAPRSAKKAAAPEATTRTSAGRSPKAPPRAEPSLTGKAPAASARGGKSAVGKKPEASSAVQAAASRGAGELPRGGGKASRKAVTPPPQAHRKIPPARLALIRDLLAQKKLAIANHLQTELSELERPEQRHRADLEEMASDTHDTDSLCHIIDIEASHIGQIDWALAKIDNGTYGICEDCNGEIPFARLEALPFATQCIECKRKAEIRGQISASGPATDPYA